MTEVDQHKGLRLRKAAPPCYFLLLLLLLLAACGSRSAGTSVPEAAVPTEPAQLAAAPTALPSPTPAPIPTEPPPPTATPLPTDTPTSPPPTATPSPTPTLNSTPAPTATPTPSFATVIASQTVNLRGGPDTAFAVVGQLQPGQSLRILAKNEDGSWWQVEGVDGEPAWVIGRLVEVQGPAEEVAVAADIPEPPQPAASTGFSYGIHVLSGPSNQAMTSTSALGFNWIALQAPWTMLEPSQGAYAWDNLDPMVDVARANGISLLVTVKDTPGWARGAGADLTAEGPPEDPNTMATFLGELAARYCGGPLRAVQVWQEPNLQFNWDNQAVDPAAYMALLKAVYAAVKEACPSMVVVSGALNPTGAPMPLAMDDFEYLQGMYQNGLKDNSDAVGVALPGYNVPPDVVSEDACAAIGPEANFQGPCQISHHSWSFRSSLEGYRNIMVQNGDAVGSMWVTLFGWPAGGATDPRFTSADDNTLQEQADWSVAAYQTLRNSGYVGAAFLFSLDARVTSPGSTVASEGIVDASWAPLPAYTALQQMPK